MKVYAISDLHLSISTPKPMDIFGHIWDNYTEDIEKDWNEKVTDDDIVLLAGDFSWAMYLEDAVKDYDYLKKLKGRKVMIRGNHDYWWQSISAVRNSAPSDMFFLQNDCVRFENILICGTRGWTVPERGREQSPDDLKIYKRELIRLELALQSATKLRKDGDILIVMIHYPPFNSGVEDSDFTNLMEKYNANICVFGHLHGNKIRSKLEYSKRGINYYLTSCDKLENKLKYICSSSSNSSDN